MKKAELEEGLKTMRSVLVRTTQTKNALEDSLIRSDDELKTAIMMLMEYVDFEDLGKANLNLDCWDDEVFGKYRNKISSETTKRLSEEAAE